MMLKDLFKFHSKEEDFRVKCLVLILLISAIVVQSCFAFDELETLTMDGTTTTGVLTDFVVKNTSAFEDVTRVIWTGTAKHPSANNCTGTWSSVIKTSAAGAVEGNFTATWDFDSCSSSSFLPVVVTIDILDFQASTPNIYETIFLGESSTIHLAKVMEGAVANLYVWSNTTSDSESEFDVLTDTEYGIVGRTHVSDHVQGVYQMYSGSDLPDAPVITDFTNDMSCYYPNQAIAFSSDVEGELEDQLTWTWTWEIYDGETKISEDTDPVEAIMTAPGVGVYDVQLTVTNAGGTDFLQKLNMINVTLAGNCTGINNWSPFPTVPTVTPTAAVFPTMTVPPVPFINRSGINDMVNESMWGNYSAAYRKYIDEVGDSVNQTVTGATGLVMTPFAFIVQGIAVVLDLFSTSLASLMTYTTVPLLITARIINVMPWQMQSLITAGLAIDAIFLLVLGKG